MNQYTDYSDEHINAYIDGELNNDECASLLHDEQNNAELKHRINEVRMLKEKIRLAFSEIAISNDIKRSFSFIEFTSRHIMLVASFIIICTLTATLTYNMSVSGDVAAAKQMIASTQAIAAHQISDAVGSDQHVVIHLSKYDENNFGNTIEHIEILLEQRKSDTAFSVELVANGQGLKALDVISSIYAERISLLADRFDSLDVIACAKSLARLADEGNPIQLMALIMITPSAAQQVAKRTEQGWIYIKI